ncbi:MAG: DNA repair ATPase, partial [Planctomycetes bacterium]|nr:DNA repair ATPase [Planctomycetota bacterium]
MAEHEAEQSDAGSEASTELRGGAYELIRNRLNNQSKALRERLKGLNEARKAAFGAVETKLLSSDRVSTANNCVPRDIVSIGDHFLFGYNVFVGLRTETHLEDVFALYRLKEGNFTQEPLDLLANPQFAEDFKNLYKYYRRTTFAKFSLKGPHLFMVFRVGRDTKDIKTFKWLVQGDKFTYLDNRSDHEFGFPPQHEFEWQRATRDMFREGRHPHVSIEDRVFVETIGGDLTIKIENNTESGEGIYTERVDHLDQTLSDALIYFAIIGNVILLKIRPYEEEAFRYILYNEKIQKAMRIDAIEEACVLLPENHGLIFPKGYYLQTGVFKLFETDMEEMVFERSLASPNGEDTLYVFYNRASGVYCLLSYNIIEQKVGTPVICNGYSFFEDGTLIYFRANEEAKKHHVIQSWQTPYTGPDFAVPVQKDSQLAKIGNRDIVRCMAECTEVLNLIAQEDTFANLYLDISRKAEDICDTYFWIDSAETGQLNIPLRAIKEAADAAIEEHEKVLRTQEHTRSEIQRVGQATEAAIRQIDYEGLNVIQAFVDHLTQLRALRGEVVSLKDLRYADIELITALEKEVADHTDQLSQRCVDFLVDPDALTPFLDTTAALAKRAEGVAKVLEVRELQEDVGQTGNELEMLTDIVSNLKIEDATQTIAIIDNISGVYAKINQVKARLQNKLKEIGLREGQAEFSAQIKLIDQLM